MLAPMLGLVLALILYGSLYPFDFRLPATPFFSWIWMSDLAGIRDIVVNVAVYMPLGLLVYNSSRRRGLLIAAATSLALSGIVEFLQAFDQGRVSSSIDLLTNVTGGVLGALIARALVPRIPRERYAVFAVVLVALLARTFPFVPVTGAHWSAPAIQETIIAIADWLLIRCALAILLNRTVVNLPLACLILASQARLFILDQTLPLSDLAGGLFALAIGYVWSNARPQQLTPALLAALIARELLPFHFTAQPQPFHWVPFETLLTSPSFGSIIFLNKLSIYGGLLWAGDPQAGRVWKTGFAVAALLLLLEWMQRYLPGRTPDITDSLLVLIAACGLAALRPST